MADAHLSNCLDAGDAAFSHVGARNGVFQYASLAAARPRPAGCGALHSDKQLKLELPAECPIHQSLTVAACDAQWILCMYTFLFPWIGMNTVIGMYERYGEGLGVLGVQVFFEVLV